MKPQDPIADNGFSSALVQAIFSMDDECLSIWRKSPAS